MTLFSFSPSLVPMAEDQTRNSDSAGGISAAYDILSLPGMLISFLEDETITSSTGEGDICVSTQMVVSHPVRSAEPASVSVGSTNSSILSSNWGTSPFQGGGCANHFRIPFTQPAMIDLASLMMLLGGFVALVVESADQKKSQIGMLHKNPAN